MVISGERVKQARELRGMTQTALAKAADVSQAAIAQIESGAFLASDDLVAVIAKRLNQPISFFQQDPAREFNTGSLLLRAHACLGKRDLTETYRHGQFVYELYMRLRSKARALPIKLKTCIGSSPERAAQDTRAALGIPSELPVPHLINVLEWNGVVAVVLPDRPSRDAFSSWEEDAPFVALSAGRSGDRLRMSVAHELGHLTIHKGMSRFDVNDEEADEFAAEFLMPADAIRREIKLPVTLSSLAALKPKWKVSIQALVRRCRDLEIITNRQYRYLFEQLSSIGWRKQEPITITPEKPRAFRQMAEFVYGEPIDTRRMAEELCVDLGMIQEMIPLYAPKAEADVRVDSKVVRMPRTR
jgi:Zn-dependent peptidase ImmA (M78 family)/transcriptional regulator with XRE-family HTH domain